MRREGRSDQGNLAAGLGESPWRSYAHRTSYYYSRHPSARRGRVHRSGVGNASCSHPRTQSACAGSCHIGKPESLLPRLNYQVLRLTAGRGSRTVRGAAIAGMRACSRCGRCGGACLVRGAATAGVRAWFAVRPPPGCAPVRGAAADETTWRWTTDAAATTTTTTTAATILLTSLPTPRVLRIAVRRGLATLVLTVRAVKFPGELRHKPIR
jgi:hypothetical protein